MSLITTLYNSYQAYEMFKNDNYTFGLDVYHLAHLGGLSPRLSQIYCQIALGFLVKNIFTSLRTSRLNSNLSYISTNFRGSLNTSKDAQNYDLIFIKHVATIPSNFRYFSTSLIATDQGIRIYNSLSIGIFYAGKVYSFSQSQGIVQSYFDSKNMFKFHVTG